MKRLSRWGRRKARRSRTARLKERAAKDRVLIFDFDGTIADTFVAAFHILNDLSDEFGFRKLGADELEAARRMNARQLMAYLGVRRAKLPSLAKRGLEELNRRIETIKPFPDIAEALRQLHSDGLLLGILTSNSSKNVHAFLRVHDLEIFRFVRCSSRLFGKAREIRALMKAHYWKPDQLLYVGDEARDVEAAKKARIQIAAVLWGYNTREALEEPGADFFLEQPKELIELLRNLHFKGKQ